MFIHDETTAYELGAITPDPQTAKWIMPLAEHLLGTTATLLCMRQSMPWQDGGALLISAAVGALNQFDLICNLFGALVEHVGFDDMLAGGLDHHYIRHTAGLGAMDIRLTGSTGDPVTDIHMAISATQRTRTMCDNILRIATAPGVARVIELVRGQQVGMAGALCGLLGEVQAAMAEQGVYAYNAAFDVCDIRHAHDQ